MTADHLAMLDAALLLRRELKQKAAQLRCQKYRYFHRQEFARGEAHALDMVVCKLTTEVIRDI